MRRVGVRRGRLTGFVLASLATCIAVWQVDSQWLATAARASAQHDWAARPPPRVPITIAYCTREKLEAPVPSESEYWMHQLGPHAFPSSAFDVRYRSVLADASQLPKGVDAASAQGLYLLGVTDAHVRLCLRGATSIVSLMLRVLANVTLQRIPGELVSARLRAAKLWEPPDERGWTHRAMLKWPLQLTLLVNGTSGLAVFPMLMRSSHEPKPESVPGCGVQLDCKRSALSGVSATVYVPFLAYSTVFRRLADNSSYGAYLGRQPGHDTASDMFLRPSGFNATRERLAKAHFASFAQKHCSHRRAYYPTVWIREMFTFALANRSAKAVHTVGACPLGDRGALRAGFASVAARTELQRRFAHVSGVAIHAQHKFAITFENSVEQGYVTEKIGSAYLAGSVPVYAGPADVRGVLNPNAFVQCDFPNSTLKLLSYEGGQAAWKTLCKTLLGTVANNCTSPTDHECKAAHRRRVGDVCTAQYEAAMEVEFMPHLLACADKVVALDGDDAAYDRMLAEPLVPVDARTGALSGAWDTAAMGRAVFSAFVGAGYAEALSVHKNYI